MFPEERKRRIIDEIEKHGKVKVSELSRIFEVTEATIRRDLQELEEKGFLKRTHGGAVFSESTKAEPTFSEKEDRFFEEKQIIGRLAANIIDDGDTIILDAGTTTLQIVRYISAKNITIVTNSLNIGLELTKRKDIEVIVVGGNIRWETLAIVGPIAEDILKNLRVDKAFIGTNGICLENGLTTPNLVEAKTKRSMLEIASQKICVCDHTKFNQVSFAKFADIEEIDMIVTDDKLSPKIVDKFREIQVEIINHYKSGGIQHD